MSLKKNDPRVRMYREARAILADGITFSKEERLEKLKAEKQALLLTRDKQVSAAAKAAVTRGQCYRATARVVELYREELEKIENQINELTI